MTWRCACKFVQAKDLDELKSWKSSVSGKLDDLIRENEAMRRVPWASVHRIFTGAVF